MTVVYTKDGIKVELERSDAGYPPGSPKGGLNLNTSAIWLRTGREKWQRATNTRSTVTIIDILRNNTLEEALKEIL